LIPAKQPVILAPGTRNDRNSSNKSPEGAISEALIQISQTNNVGLGEEKRQQDRSLVEASASRRVHETS
jgi:hypothetical protein